LSDHELVLALRSEDPEDRRIAAGRLSEVQSGRAELVISALGDEDWRVREEARQVARSLAPDPDMLAALVDALRPTENVGLRNAAVDALGAYGELAIEALARAMSSLDADGRKLAVEALAATRQPGALFVLRGGLEDEDPNVRAATLEAVSSLGTTCPDEVAGVLGQCLDDSDQFIQLIALNGLNQLGVAVPWARLEPLLESTLLRRAAVEALGRTGAVPAAEALVHLLSVEGGERTVALEAAATLAERGGAARIALSQGLAALPAEARRFVLALAEYETDELDLRRSAVRLLGLLRGPEAAKIAVFVLSDERVLEEAQIAVVELGAEAAQVLIEAVREQEGEERAAAVELLGRVTAEVAPGARAQAVHVLCELVSDRSPDGLEHGEVVRAALDALGDVGDEGALDAVANLLSGEVDPSWQRSAERALSALALRFPEHARRSSQGDIEQHAALVLHTALAADARRRGDVEAVDASLARLWAGLSAPVAATRRVALEGLGAIGDERSVSAVAFTLTDEEPTVRVTAVQTLGRLRSQSGVAVGADALLSILTSGRDGDLMAAAAAALGKIGDAKILDSLAPLVCGPDAQVAVAAVEAIAHIPGLSRLDVLLPGLEHASVEVIKATLRAIAGEREPRVLVHVGRFLDHEAWDVRRQAADALGRLGGEAEILLLRAKLDVEREPLVRDALERALEELGALRRTPMPPQPGSYRAR
jgi:HEAT repeat protein